MKANFKSSQLKSVNVQGEKIFYREVGEATAVPIVLLHHITAVIDDWDPYIIDELAKERKVIAFDNKGVGASSGSTPDSIEAMADVAIDFIDKLGFTKVDLLGYSMGGFIAQIIISRRPELVRKLILADTGAAGGKGIDRIWDILQESFAYAEKEQKHPKQKLFFKSTSESQEAGTQFLKRLGDPFAESDQAISQEAIQAQVKAFITWGKSNDVYTKAISIPTLIVTGDQDEMIPLKNAYDLYTKINDSFLSVYPNSGHGSIFQYKELFVQQSNKFLNN
ncbi:alpha/beta hydrolase [Pedobacter riviphilus]|uniref:Alpha/beta hydrolase n=1 Tax=Pedobacter riviphilus TaxID=2766984 RepID=A0ABX6TIW8_9SPHI|nr:alpha/beta hydrolase [Pedobacter riviphilus]QNR84851.1 alpha/beta hydrolase [Pedobacter riviphilus]